MGLGFLVGDDKLNDHEQAWRSKDWDAVKKLADSFKEKEANEFFYILNQINDRNRTRIDTLDFESYSQFAINQMLSKHVDCIYHAYAMNMLDLNDQMHFDYLFHSVRPAKRYGGANDLVDPIESMAETVFIKSVSRFYGVNTVKAADYVENFSEEQIKILKRRFKPTITDEFIKDACPYAKKTDIAKISQEIDLWNK